MDGISVKPESASTAPGATAVHAAYGGRFLQGPRVRGALEFFDSIACLMAFVMVFFPLIFPLASVDVSMRPELELIFSVEVLLGTMILHWRLKRFLIPMSGRILDELTQFNKMEQRRRKRSWSGAPNGLFVLGYAPILGMALFCVINFLVDAEITNDKRVFLYADSPMIFYFTLWPLLCVIVGVLWQARWANRFLVERCEKADRSEKETTAA